MAVDLLLKGGMVVTEGGGVLRADVAVSGEKIVGITAPGETGVTAVAEDTSGFGHYAFPADWWVANPLYFGKDLPAVQALKDHPRFERKLKGE